jgi:cytochrome P450
VKSYKIHHVKYSCTIPHGEVRGPEVKMSKQIPGGAGLTVVGDKSLEFYKDAVTFVNKRLQQHESRLFLSRLLNKPTVFVASNSAVHSLLNDDTDKIDLGYKSFMQGIYGDNVIFADKQEVEELRKILHELMSPDVMQQFQTIVTKLTSKVIDSISPGEIVSSYDLFKKLATEICLSIFLDIDFETSQELSNQIVALTTTHWHGIISVPFSLSLPMMSQSTYTKALEAKNTLLQIIEDKLSKSKNGFPHMMSKAAFPSTNNAASHVLLFTSALVPKALASILTSFVIQLGDRKSLQDEILTEPTLLQHVLLEVERLWPPFFGGRRLVRKKYELDGYTIPAGHAIVYMTQHAQRDPDVFPDPEDFMPERWQDGGINSKDRDKLFLFGDGGYLVMRLAEQPMPQSYHP